MKRWFKSLWWIAIALNFGSNLLVIVAATANFQRSMDLESRFMLVIIGIPSLILLIMSVGGLLTQSSKDALLAKYIAATIIIVFLVVLIPINVRLAQSQAEGWLYDYVSSDPLKLTADGKYEYRMDLLNNSQRNHKEVLYIKERAGTEEKHIRLPIHEDSSKSYSFGSGRGDWGWARMMATTEPDQYELTTTEYLDVPIQTFMINVREGTAELISVEQ